MLSKSSLRGKIKEEHHATILSLHSKLILHKLMSSRLELQRKTGSTQHLWVARAIPEAPSIVQLLACSSPRAMLVATWNVLVLVLLKMSVQVGLLPKAPVAQVAFEWLLLVMDVSNVPLEVGGNAE